MSSRALRRLQDQKGVQLPCDSVEDDENIEEDVEIKQVVKKKKNKKATSQTGNLFDLLATEEDTIADEEEDDEPENNENDRVVPSTTVKKKKKKKKKKKESNKQTKEDDHGEKDNELDEIDRSVREVNEILGIQPNTMQYASSTEETPVFRSKSILTVDPRNLNPDNEMKRKFGSAVVQNERRRNPHERRFKRNTCLVAPKPNWPPYSKVGVTMNPLKSGRSLSMFTFEHQESYRKVQFMFYDAVESIDHNNIVALLNAHPYHIDSMLQLSEICKINEDYQMAAELIERALFVFECSFHTLFNVTQGTCRLEYRRAENRPFFLALFRHITYIGNKACYRTALEFCKVLLGLDPSEDPLCVLLLLDYYALKCEEYKYFIQLTDEYEHTKNVSLLPNFAFSYALAKFYLGKMDEANKALRKALISFPSLVIELMNKCGISLDDIIKNHAYFNPDSYIQQAGPLNQLISLYVGRCDSLWKAPEILNWLAENCKYIIDNYDSLTKELNAAKERRETRYKKSPRNILRHIVISDIKEALRALPVEVRNETVMQYDPLPPLDSVAGYEKPTRTTQNQQNGGFLSLFLQSLLPSYNQEEVARQVQQGQQQQQQLQDQARALEGDDTAPMNAIHGGAQQLMNAMRELLTTMTYRNDLVEGDDHNEDEDNEHDDAEWNE